MRSTAVEIIGRTSSLFTRVTRIFAHELGIEVDLVIIHDLRQLGADVYGGNPARKLPTLRRDGSLVWGAENICRALAEQAPAAKRIVWPEALHGDLSRNAQELVWHAMAAQVQLVFGTVVNQLPADNLYFTKGRAGFEGALAWLDATLEATLAALPAERELSLFEVSLFCLVEHLEFRGSLLTAPYPALVAFARAFAARPSAQATTYQLDPPAPA